MVELKPMQSYSDEWTFVMILYKCISSFYCLLMVSKVYFAVLPFQCDRNETIQTELRCVSGGGRGEDLCSLPDHRLHN